MANKNNNLKMQDKVVIKKTGESGKIIYFYPNDTFGVLTPDGAIRTVTEEDVEKLEEL